MQPSACGRFERGGGAPAYPGAVAIQAWAQDGPGDEDKNLNTGLRNLRCGLREWEWQAQIGPGGRIRTYQVRIYHNMSETGKKRVEEMSHHWTGSESDAESPMELETNVCTRLQTSFLHCGMLVEEKVRRRAQIMSEWRQWRRLHATFGGCGEYLMFNSGGGGEERKADQRIWIPEVIFGHQGVSDDVRHLRMGHPFESREVEGLNAIFGHILPGHLILDFPTWEWTMRTYCASSFKFSPSRSLRTQAQNLYDVGGIQLTQTKLHSTSSSSHGQLQKQSLGETGVDR
ncbi:hypothetical protein C8J57DRAFT_1254571 [Mycena rebaudengoi]|nr:hypothetical protein C8J57DRAFT_1254571 [Mycena rebaudengoi]